MKELFLVNYSVKGIKTLDQLRLKKRKMEKFSYAV